MNSVHVLLDVASILHAHVWLYMYVHIHVCMCVTYIRLALRVLLSTVIVHWQELWRRFSQQPQRL